MLKALSGLLTALSLGCAVALVPQSALAGAGYEPGWHLTQDQRERPSDLFGIAPFSGTIGYRQALYAIARVGPPRPMTLTILQRDTRPLLGGEDFPTTLEIRRGTTTFMSATPVNDGYQATMYVPSDTTLPISFVAQYLGGGGVPVSSESESYAVILTAGSNLYQVLAQKGLHVNLGGDRPITQALSSYMDPMSGAMRLGSHQAIILFETTHNSSHQGLEEKDFDYNDLIVLVTMNTTEPIAKDSDLINRIGVNSALTDNNNGPETTHNIWTAWETLAASKVIPSTTLNLSQVRWVGFPNDSNPNPGNWSYRLDVWSSEAALAASPYSGDIADIALGSPTVGPSQFGVSSYSTYSGMTLEMTFDVSSYKIKLNKNEDYIIGMTVYLLPATDGRWRVSASDLTGLPDYYVMGGSVFPMNYWGAPPQVAFHMRGIPPRVSDVPTYTAVAADCTPGAGC